MKAVPGKQDVWSPWVYNEALCCVCSLSHVHLFVSVWLFTTPWTAVCQPPLSMEFSRQECWSGSPFPIPGYLPNSGIKPASPAGAGGFFFFFFFYHWATWEAWSSVLMGPKTTEGILRTLSPWRLGPGIAINSGETQRQPLSPLPFAQIFFAQHPWESP